MTKEEAAKRIRWSVNTAGALSQAAGVLGLNYLRDMLLLLQAEIAPVETFLNDRE